MFLLCELARGSMGEIRASGESILGGLIAKETCVKDNYLSIMQNTAYLHNLGADKLKYVHSEALGYVKCGFTITLKEALTIKSMNGAKKYAC